MVRNRLALFLLLFVFIRSVASIEEVDYTKCETEKRCMFLKGTEGKEDCGKDKPESCVATFTSAAEPDGQKVAIELTVNWGADAEYAALGFSDDEKMGDDYVVYCNGKYKKVTAAYNPGGTPPTGKKRTPTKNLANQTSAISNVKTGFIPKKNTFICRFKLATATPMEFTKFNTINKELYIFLAAGLMRDATSIAQHLKGRHASSEKMNIAKPLAKTVEEVDYTKCGTEKRCMFVKETEGIDDCDIDKPESCVVTFTSAAEPDGQKVAIELTVNIKTAAEYGALGFSDDEKMGDDYVVYCNGKYRKVTAAYNPGGTPPTGRERTRTHNLEDQKSAISDVETSYNVQKRYFICRFKLATAIPMEFTKFNTINQDLYIFLAAGRMRDRTNIAKHKKGRHASSERINIAKPLAKPEVTNPEDNKTKPDNNKTKPGDDNTTKPAIVDKTKLPKDDKPKPVGGNKTETAGYAAKSSSAALFSSFLSVATLIALATLPLC